MDVSQTRVLLKCARLHAPAAFGNGLRLIDLPCDLLELIFRCPSLHHVERVLLGRTCRRLHGLQRTVYPFPTRQILSKSTFYTSIASFLVQLEQQLPLMADGCTDYSYRNAMASWLLPFRKVMVPGSWALRMAGSELGECIRILRQSCFRAPTAIFAISYILGQLPLTNKQWIGVCLFLMRPIGHIWPSQLLFSLMAKQWPRWSNRARRVVIQEAQRFLRFDLGDSLASLTS